MLALYMPYVFLLNPLSADTPDRDFIFINSVYYHIGR